MPEDPFLVYEEALEEGDPYTATLAAMLNGVQPLCAGDEWSASEPVIVWPGC